MRHSEDELVPGHGGKVDLLVPVCEAKVSEDRGFRRIFSTDRSLSSYKETLGLIEVGGRTHVRRNDFIVPPDTVHLDGQQDRDVERLQLRGELHHGCTAKAHAVEDHASRATFLV